MNLKIPGSFSFKRVNSITQIGSLILVCWLSPAQAAQAAERPNILFIAIDDLRNELGCYGVDEIHSPNIDRLASGGVLFERAYCQVAVCNPSRVSILTGLRPDSTRVWTLDVRFRDTIPEAVTLPQHFKSHGYQTLGFGKIFHNPWPDNISWSEPHSWPENSSLWSKEAKEALTKFKATMKADGKPKAAIDRLRAVATEIVDIPDSEHIDGAIADQAIAAMREAAGKETPFFIAAGFVRPHLPFVVPRNYWDLYDRESLPLATNPSLPKGAPQFSMNTMYELRDYMDFLGTPAPHDGSLTESQQRELKHGYYASISFIDAQVGRLLKELEALELSDDTIVVLWSDHGWKLGEHNSWCKQTNHEIDARVPLIIKDPRSESNGQRSASLVELVDVFPTLCDLTGLPIPEELEGLSLKPVLDDPEATVKDFAMSQFPRRSQGRELMGYSMRTDTSRYIEWIDRQTKETVARELYDHETDPLETRNVASGATYQDQISTLGNLLREVLPLPLAAERVAKKAKQTTRPTLHFRNGGAEIVRIRWLPKSGEPRLVGELKPGETKRVNTTMGHRFRIEEGGNTRVITVTREDETFSLGLPAAVSVSSAAPNIVVIMGDDWSWPHASILGDPVVRTPNFDRIAKEGILFENAFAVSPSCTPSRHSVTSGQYHWRLGEGADLGGSIARETPVYPDILAAAGYETGFCRKGTGPSKHTYRNNDPLGNRYGNFDEFFDQHGDNGPFCFWYGAGEPHRPYEWEKSLEGEMDLSSISVPAFLPDNDTIRTDLGHYYLRVEKLDQLAGQILKRLEETGELENTIVVMTGDNGMPFPRAKATLYDSGTRVPLAIRWGRNIPAGRTITDFVDLTDLAPTFLEAVGLPVPDVMTGRSLLPLMLSEKSGPMNTSRDRVLTGMETHVYPNPSRAIRTKDFLYLRNFAPEAWPTGESGDGKKEYDFRETPWPTEAGAFSHNIDPGPTKQWMLINEPPQNTQAFGRRPAEELYDLTGDPDQTINLLASKSISQGVEETRRKLSDRLTRELRESKDPLFAKPGHATFDVNGWTIHLNDALWANERVVTSRMLELLNVQLQRVVDVTPPKALAQLRSVPIWINPPYEGQRGTAEYHGEGKWLEKNGRNPKMAKSIEITNARNFPFENRRMPYVMLHELAHAYHDQVLADGFRNAELRAAYERARDSGSYDEVARFNGNETVQDKAYAMNNPMEYFAESTEAYFGKNDFFPFNREELKAHDPIMHDLVGKLWKR